MKTLSISSSLPSLIQVAPPTAADRAAANGKWWPDLYLKKGRKLQLITPEQCGVVRNLFNDGRGSSEIRGDMKLFDVTGEHIGHVSYNGRVWLHDIEGNVEVPVEGIPTAAEREAKGWSS